MGGLWKAGDGPNCATGEPRVTIQGEVATIVLIDASACCRADAREHMGIVYFGYEPMGWTCLTDPEVAAFLQWVTARYGAARVIRPNAPPLPQINCPPPGVSDTERARMRDALTVQLRALARLWFTAAMMVA
jgi:hypothetical protein